MTTVPLLTIVNKDTYKSRVIFPTPWESKCRHCLQLRAQTHPLLVPLWPYTWLLNEAGHYAASLDPRPHHFSWCINQYNFDNVGRMIYFRENSIYVISIPVTLFPCSHSPNRNMPFKFLACVYLIWYLWYIGEHCLLSSKSRNIITANPSFLT